MTAAAVLDVHWHPRRPDGQVCPLSPVLGPSSPAPVEILGTYRHVPGASLRRFRTGATESQTEED